MSGYYYYYTTIRKDLFIKLNLQNQREIPKLEALILNFGLKRGLKEKFDFFSHVILLELLGGQKPVLTQAKRTNPALGVSQNQKVTGCKVTITNKSKMFNALERLSFLILDETQLNLGNMYYSGNTAQALIRDLGENSQFIKTFFFRLRLSALAPLNIVFSFNTTETEFNKILLKSFKIRTLE